MTTGRSLFSLFPPAFAAVPQYLVHTTVELLSLTEPDKRLSHTYGSSARHSVRLRLSISPFFSTCRAFFAQSVNLRRLYASFLRLVRRLTLK